MAEDIYLLEDGKGGHMIGISTYNKPPCKDGEHQWDGDGLMTFYNHDPMSGKEFEALPENERRKLKQKSGQVTCSRCGIGYMEYDNPYYSEI